MEVAAQTVKRVTLELGGSDPTLLAACARLGARWGYALMIVWWSAANALHGLAGTVTQLGAVRFALGLGEGGGFPGSAKAVAEWFKVEERAFAFGLFNTGSSLGAVIAPLRPRVTRTVYMVHRVGPLSPAARAFIQIAGI